jgi:diacylglycerol kinase family enzyme
MLARDDGIKLPIAVIPNGSGNDTCRSLGVDDVDAALELIVNAEVLPMDTIRVLIDTERFEDITQSESDALDRCRYMINDCCLAMSARISYEAAKYKGCFGANCYAVATLQEAFLLRNH